MIPQTLSALRQVIWWAVGLVVVAAAAVTIYAHTALDAVVKGLPIDVLDQERDVAFMVNDLSNLLRVIEAARTTPTAENVQTVRDSLLVALDRVRHIRTSYDFNDLAGASALHAAVSPALQDAERWLTDGFPGHPPESAVVLRFVETRLAEVYAKSRDLYRQSHEEARSLLVEQEERLDRFRNRLVLLVGFTVVTVAGLVLMIVLQRRIIEERRIAQMALIKAKEEAELASHAKSEFLANMSHELRTPLNAILGFAEVIRAEMLGAVGTPKYREYANDIHESGQHLLNIINDILDLSKVEAGKYTLSEGMVDAAETVAAAVRVIRPRAEAAGLGFEARTGTDLPNLWADARALRQVLINLLSNAVKFTPAGRVDLTCGVLSDGRFAFTVRDTGIGMSIRDISVARTPFGQVQRAMTRTHEGTGLGLPLVESLVQLHGGTVEIESRVGEGTVVTVCLPAERVIRSAAPGPAPRLAAD